MQTVDNYLGQKVVEYFGYAETFDQRIIFIRNRMIQIQKSVCEKKAANPELPMGDVRAELIEFHGLHYEHQMMEQELRRLSDNLVEVYTAVKLFKIELPLNETQIGKLDDLTSSLPPRLYIVEKGKVKIADEELYQSLTAGLEAHIQSERALKDMFNSPSFSQK